MSADYSMRVLEYCHVPEQKTEVLWGGVIRPGETVDFPFPVILIQAAGVNIMVECGIDWREQAVVDQAKVYGVEDLHQMPDLLAEIGMKPEDIDYIIPTHGHWDHMGGINFFPNAKIILQKDDYFGWIECLAKPKEFADLWGPCFISHFKHVLDAVDEHRVVFLDGPVKEVLPGIDIEVDYNGHSFASQLIVVHNTKEDGSSDDYMICGDVIYSVENVFGADGVPGFVPCTMYNSGSKYETMKTYQRLKEFANGDPSRLIPVHDYLHWKKYPTKTLPKSGMHFAEIRLREGDASML